MRLGLHITVEHHAPPQTVCLHAKQEMSLEQNVVKGHISDVPMHSGSISLLDQLQVG